MKYLKNSKYIVFFFITAATSSAQSHYPGQHQSKLKVEETKNIRLTAFYLEDVKLPESPFKDNMVREGKWIMDISANALTQGYTLVMKAHTSFSNPKLYNDYYTYDYRVPASISTKLDY